jgi:hypothetical protein
MFILLITSNVACQYINFLEYEAHAMYNPQTHNKRPVDAVVPWLLRDCGVEVFFESYYGTVAKDPIVMRRWPAHDRCTPNICPFLYTPIPG